MGRRRLLVARGVARASMQERIRLGPSVCRRYAGAGARSRTWTHQDGTTVGLRARAMRVGRTGAAGSSLSLRAGSQG